MVCDYISPPCTGPLHGLANQEVLAWLTNVIKQVGPEATKEQLKEFLWTTLKSGQVRRGEGEREGEGGICMYGRMGRRSEERKGTVSVETYGGVG